MLHLLITRFLSPAGQAEGAHAGPLGLQRSGTSEPPPRPPGLVGHRLHTSCSHLSKVCVDGGHRGSPGALLVAAERRGHLRRAVKDEASSGAVHQGELSHAAECPGEGGLGVRTAPPLGAGQGREWHPRRAGPRMWCACSIHSSQRGTLTLTSCLKAIL